MAVPVQIRLGALQIGASPNGTAATLDNLMSYRQELEDSRLGLLVLPEALLGGYPKGADFGARLGYRTPDGRDAYLDYWSQAVEIGGRDLGVLCTLAREVKTALVAGIVERDGGTLYCTAVFITAAGDIAGRHRKLMPTAVERLVWGQAAELELTIMDTSAGRVGAAICWENYMPLYRYALYEKGIDVWCAPTVDDREIWRTSMRHIAYEGRCFVVSACQVQPPSTLALDRPITLRDRTEDQPMIRGGSMIVSPLGEVLAGPLEGTEGLLTAEVDRNEIVRARFDLDVVGHYSRSELFGRRPADPLTSAAILVGKL